MAHFATGFFLLLTSTFAFAAAATPMKPTASGTAPSHSLKWTACTSPWPQTFRCSKLQAPLHYDAPQGKPVTLQVVKIPAKNPSKRIGSWVYQEGGPGYATSEDVVSYDNTPGFKEVQEVYDIVVMDPRGVGTNYPVKCDPKVINRLIANTTYPRTEKAWQDTANAFATVGQDCKTRTGEDIWPTLDTQTSARDLETLRIALGEGNLNYYGLSWGTQRGQQYAQLYPNNIRTMVLDAVLNHAYTLGQVRLSDALSLTRAIEMFYSWASTNSTSPLYGQDVKSILINFVAQLERKPIELPACISSGQCHSPLTAENIRTGIFSGLEHTTSFPVLAEKLVQAMQGNFTAWEVLLTTKESDQPVSFLPISCADWTVPQTYAEFASWGEAVEAMSGTPLEVSSAARSMMIACPKFPIPVVNPNKAFTIANISAPILIVGSTADPETGYDMAVSLQSQIAGSVLLTRDGEGHGTFGIAPLGEGHKLIVDYIVTGKTPALGTVVST